MSHGSLSPAGSVSPAVGAVQPTRLELVIAGTPRARPRLRHGARLIKGKAVSFSYRPTKIQYKDGKPTHESLAWSRAEAWYEAVRFAVAPHLPRTPWDGPVWVSADVYFERPQRLNRRRDPEGPVWCTAKPDRDNLEKSITDALTTAGLWGDDAQVVDGPIRKFYAAKGHGPGVHLLLVRIDPHAPIADISGPPCELRTEAGLYLAQGARTC